MVSNSTERSSKIKTKKQSLDEQQEVADNLSQSSPQRVMGQKWVPLGQQ